MGKQKVLAFDIETVKNRAADEYVKKHMKVKYGNTKDPEKKEIKRRTAIDDGLNKAGLNWVTGKVCSFALVDTESLQEQYVFSSDEGKVLAEFSELVRGAKLVGMSSAGFDIPFLVGRFMAYDLPVPAQLKERYPEDVNNYFGYSNAFNQRGSLDSYAWGLGMEMKTSNGGAVQGLYDAITMGKDETIKSEAYETLKDYNVHDSIIVANMYNKYHKGE